jgi:hypothetical protein
MTGDFRLPDSGCPPDGRRRDGQAHVSITWLRYGQPEGRRCGPAWYERTDRASFRRRKTGHPIRFELRDRARDVVDK